MASDPPPPRSVNDDVNATGGHQDNRVVSQDNEVIGESEIDKAKHQVLCVDDKTQACIKKDDDHDKWKPVIDTSEKDKMLMPPPGAFLRPSAGYNSYNNITDFPHNISP